MRKFSVYSKLKLEKKTVHVSVNLYSVVASLPGTSHSGLVCTKNNLIELKLIVNLIGQFGRLI